MRFLVALMIAQNMQKFRFKLALYQRLSVVVKDITIGVHRCDVCFFFFLNSKLCYKGVEKGSATRYMLRHNTASIMKI